MERALQVVSIIISIMLIILVLLQAKGSGVGNLLGGDPGGGLTRTRRGLEKTLFQITIVISAVFLLVAIFAVAVFSGR